MNHSQYIKSKIISYDDIETKVIKWKNENKKIGFTNGCFDVIHYGHVKYLAKAKELSDILILGLNSDKSVKMLKGEDRPINNQEHRAFVLAALSMIDAIVIFNEQTPENLIKKIVPDIITKGGDYKPEQIAGSDFIINNGGEVIIIDFVEGLSSSEIIRKQKK